MWLWLRMQLRLQLLLLLFCLLIGFNPILVLGASANIYTDEEPVHQCERGHLIPKKKRHRIYDCIIFNHEFELLEIRINELHQEVSFFVIVESEVTFTNLKRSTNSNSTWSNISERLAQFTNQIILISLESLEGSTTWEREAYLRNTLLNLDLYPTMAKPNVGDVFIVSDVDEIPRPSILRSLAACEGIFPNENAPYLALNMQMSYYSFCNVDTSEPWGLSKALLYTEEVAHQLVKKELTASKLRTGIKEITVLNDAGWHCSFCFQAISQFRHKLNSFSHTEYNLAELKKPEHIVSCIKDGKDLLGRAWVKFPLRECEAKTSAPMYVLSNVKRFQYLLDRRSSTAELSDVEWWRDHGRA